MTPMMQQWNACKKSQPDAVLLFRLGDFYEAFHDDAKILADVLDLTLTARGGTPMSGLPYHAAESYIDKLVENGYLVAIAEQMSLPGAQKGIVKREIVRTVSPGTHLSKNLSGKKPSYFACLTKVNATFGLALLDHTTGEFTVCELSSVEDLNDELFRRQPKELLSSAKSVQDRQDLLDELNQNFQTRITLKEEAHFDHRIAYDFLTHHFGVQSLDCFGIKGLCAAINAAGGLLSHIQNLALPIDHITSMKPNFLSDYMAIDKATQAGLELITPLHDGHTNHTLLKHLDHTKTAMGARLLRNWVIHPLLKLEKIHARQQAAEELKDHTQVCALLKEIRDLERLMTRISSGYGSPRDLLALRLSLEVLPQVQDVLSSLKTPFFEMLKIADLSELCSLIEKAITDKPPMRLSDGGIIREGFHAELDELLDLKKNSQSWLANYQVRLRSELDIKSLKVSFNKAFGYSIEVTRAQSHKMPETFHKRQTLVNTERFISPELKTYEEKILGAEEKILALEQKLFEEVRQKVLEKRQDILKTAKSIAVFDCLLSFAILSLEAGYIFPTVDQSDLLHIEGGRHPILEKCLPAHTFIPNDAHLDSKNRLFVITGPNMAGKSTYIRQVALLTIMAQIGCPIPADNAHIGLVDKVFSRIGASDDLARGQSTFMVEMSETANILHNATNRSLIILDEIGRGTSTYDGVAIAWAVAEYLLTQSGKRAKTLFATHYFELTALEEKIPGAINYNVAVHEAEDKITFLRKIQRGDTDKSYGIHVARLAGLPKAAINSAKQMLNSLEKRPQIKPATSQLSLFEKPTKPHPIIESLKNLDIHHMTPIEALQQLAEWQKELS